MKYSRIISFGAHPLDAELQGGPITIVASASGAKCTMLHLTTGRLERKDATQQEKDAYLESLLLEMQQAASQMGCDLKALGYSSANLPTPGEFIEIFKAYLIAEKADLVITHARGTLHPRHYYCYECATEAIRQLNAQGYKIDLLYGENCEDLIGFIPTAYFPFNEQQVAQWFKALSNYSIFKGQVNDVPYLQYYQSMLKVRAIEVGSKISVKAYMNAGLINNFE